MAGFHGLSLSTPFQHYPHSVCLLSQRGCRHFPGITLLAQRLQWTVCGWRYIEWGKEEDREIRQRDRERERGKQGEVRWEVDNRKQDGDANICWAQSCGTMAWQAGDRFKKGDHPPWRRRLFAEFYSLVAFFTGQHSRSVVSTVSSQRESQICFAFSAHSVWGWLAFSMLAWDFLNSVLLCCILNICVNPCFRF